MNQKNKETTIRAHLSMRGIQEKVDDFPDFIPLIANVIPVDQQEEVAYYIRQQIHMDIAVRDAEKSKLLEKDKKRLILLAQQQQEQLDDLDILLRSLFNNYPLEHREFWYQMAKNRDINLLTLSKNTHQELYKLRAIANDVVIALQNHPIKRGAPTTILQDFLMYKIYKKLHSFKLKSKDAMLISMQILKACNYPVSPAYDEASQFRWIQKSIKAGKGYAEKYADQIKI